MLIASKKNESSSSILRGLKSDGSGFPIASEDKDTIRGTMDGGTVDSCKYYSRPRIVRFLVNSISMDFHRPRGHQI